MSLTAKQEAFVQEYLIDLNATQAATRAGYSGGAGEGFYTYVLCDPANGRIFYVGKGTGRRAWQHTREAKAGRIGNAHKHRAIIDVLASGVDPLVIVLDQHNDERDSLAAEAVLIDALKHAGLTNIKNGVCVADTAAAIAEDVLSRMVGFKEWTMGMSDSQRASVERFFGGARFFYDYCVAHFRAAARVDPC